MKEEIFGKVYFEEDESDHCSHRYLIQDEKEVFDLDDIICDFEGKKVKITVLIEEI